MFRCAAFLLFPCMKSKGAITGNQVQLLSSLLKQYKKIWFKLYSPSFYNFCGARIVQWMSMDLENWE